MFDLSERRTDGTGPMIWAPMSEYKFRSNNLRTFKCVSAKLIN